MSEVVIVAITAAGDDPGEEEDRLTASMTILPFTEVTEQNSDKIKYGSYIQYEKYR